MKNTVGTNLRCILALQAKILLRVATCFYIFKILRLNEFTVFSISFPFEECLLMPLLHLLLMLLSFCDKELIFHFSPCQNKFSWTKKIEWVFLCSLGLITSLCFAQVYAKRSFASVHELKHPRTRSSDELHFDQFHVGIQISLDKSDYSLQSFQVPFMEEGIPGLYFSSKFFYDNGVDKKEQNPL